MFRTALLILSGNATASLLLLARNLVVARLIPVEDYGIAATFAVVMAMVEMASAFGLQQQIVQSKDGDDPRFQAALQGFQVLRGVAAGIALFLIAGPIARFLGIPEVIWAYQLLALVPVIKAFEHFDIHRFNRQMRFWPMILTGGVPALLSLLLVWPLAVWLGDWRVLLYAILAQMSLLAITSHLVAERPYRLIFDRAIMGGSLRFGWPILANSVLLFLVFQGDKLIVGKALGMEALAVFAMGMTLTLTPTMVIATSTQRFFLPQLSKLNRGTLEGENRFQYLTAVALELHILIAVSFVCFITFSGQIIVGVLLGQKYTELVSLLTLFSIIQSLRLIKAGPSVIALANGQTENSMVSNLPRVFLMPAIYWIASEVQKLDIILMVSIMGEVAGLIVAFVFLRQRARVRLRSAIVPGLLALVVFVMAIFETNTNFSEFAGSLILVLLFASFLTMTHLKKYLLRRLSG